MCITWPHICFTIHLLWCMIYIVIGSVQLVSGVFFFVSLPILKLGSNIWVGIWNILFGVGGAVIALIGKWTLRKQRTFLYLAVSVLIANVVNLVILEIGEWHILLPEAAKKLIEQGNLKMLVLYARTITSLSTIVAAVVSFVDSQITFCSMQYHEKVYHKKASEKQDMLSDTEYVLPRVKSDSDDNENASLFQKQYPQSWVFETQTAETSTINSVPNRDSQTSEEPVLDSKQTSSETEFKDISTQNLNIEQPVVVVENTSDYTDRQLHYMATFSRTPSPVAGSDTSSENSCSIQGPAIQECLEKLTEPSVYKSHLDTALSTNSTLVERPAPSMSPRPPSISAQDQLHHDSLMVELQETISNKSEKIIEVAETIEQGDMVEISKITQKAVPIRQDTVISLERQDTVISLERQDTVIEVVDETASNLATSSFDADEDAQTNGDVESNYSNNVSTDKETIIEFKSDDEVEMPCHETEEEPPPCVGICDTLDLIEGIQCEPKKRGFFTKSSNVCEIDDIFKIAENVEGTTDDFLESVIRDTARVMEPVLEDSKEEVTSSEPKDDSVSESGSELKEDIIPAPQTESLLHDEPLYLLKEDETSVSCLPEQDLMEELIFEPRPSKSESFDSNINNVKDESDTDREEDKDSVKNVEPISIGSSIDIPPPEIDQLAEGSTTDQETDSSDFAIPAPPGEEDEALNNGVDPDEWDESEDDDSVDSSCVQRVPPTTSTQ